MIRMEGDRILADVHRVELPVTLRPLRRWSDAELLQFCERNKGLRIERLPDGRIPVHEPRDTRSGMGLAHLNGQFWAWTEGDGRGEAFSNTGWVLPDTGMLRPPLSWLSLARWNTLTPEEKYGFPVLCPEFVIEWKSTVDDLAALREKMSRWLANGVELGWLMDPETRTVEVFRPGREPELLSGADRITADGPVSGFVLDLTSIWSEEA